jgi:hypothetical protein
VWSIVTATDPTQRFVKSASALKHGFQFQKSQTFIYLKHTVIDISVKMMKTGNKLVSILLLVVLLLGHTSSRNAVRAQVVVEEAGIDENGEMNSDPVDSSGLSIDLGGLLGAVGNTTQDLGGLLGGLLGNATDFLSGLFGGSTDQGQDDTLDLSVLLDFVDDQLGIDLGNLTGTLDSLIGDLNDMSNDTVSLDINKIINSALACDNLLSLAGVGLTCLTNLDVDESAPLDPNNCTPQCKLAFEKASRTCPDLVNVIFGGVGLSEVCGLPVVAASTPVTAPTPVTTPVPTPTSQVPTTATPSATPSTPDVSGIVQGGETATTLDTSSAVGKGFLYTSMVIAVMAI